MFKISHNYIYKLWNIVNIMKKKFNIIIEEGEDGYLIAEVVGLPACRTQAKNYDELISRVKEVIELYFIDKKDEQIKNKFVSFQQLEIEV